MRGRRCSDAWARGDVIAWRDQIMAKLAVSKKTSGTKSKAAKVMIVDDHELVCRGFASLLAEEPDLRCVGNAGSIEEALQLFKEEQPDVVIVDLSLRDDSGVDLIKKIRKISPQVKILVSSMHDESLYAERVLRAGASGYVNKRDAPHTLLSAIRQILLGELHFNPRIAERLLKKQADGAPPTIRASVERLSAREREIFEMVGKGLPTREIAVILKVSVKTVETHRENIKRKLRLRSSLELSRRAIAWAMECAEAEA